ncbi:MAG: pyruvate kinase [Solirubrobacteraceae bacterium]
MLSGALDLGLVTRDLLALRASVLAAEADAEPVLARLSGDARQSAVNLTHYLALRSHDVRELQRGLAHHGLSSLGRSEGRVLASLDTVLGVLDQLSGDGALRAAGSAAAPDYDAGPRILGARVAALLGPPARGRRTRIMVTLPSKAAADPALVRAMSASGMDVARINTAHDGPEAWEAMVRNVRAIPRPGGAPCGVYMDLPGPKCRTGEVPDGRPLKLHADDRLALLRDGDPCREPAEIGCSLAIAFAEVRPGERALFDDGKIAGVVETVAPDRIEVRITRAGVGKAKLRANKGINFPDTDLSDAAMPDEDFALLEVVAQQADIAGLSFISRPEDVRAARATLDGYGGEHVGLMLKIETAQGFERLPDLLVEALSHERPFGVMIARGDLAVEIGPERLAEVQEEVLWLCEAAHVPVVWATQVLEGLAKTGFPSRAEITDAAMGAHAECVMLNKGPRIVDAIATLDSILRRMAAHHEKKTPLLRRLTAWD